MFINDFEIPPRIRITARTTYQVLWIESFKDPTQLGECDYENKQIILKKNLKPIVTYWVFFHELLHAISFHDKLNLRERQVDGIEIAFTRMHRLNKWHF